MMLNDHDAELLAHALRMQARMLEAEHADPEARALEARSELIRRHVARSSAVARGPAAG